MIRINQQLELADDELEWQFIRASGPGGQHVNKTSTAVQLVLDIRGSSLPDWLKQRLLNRADHRITQSGKILIKCQQSRSQEQNREQALAQLIQLLAVASVQQKKRTATKPTYGSQQRRIQQKKQRGATKALRQGKPQLD
ncbi:alternative ribosome rescue aminoacyl-tRNA hydrolase ArfB [Alkalimonas sp. MEB108]|uniref:Alternative ribosome rescue aminoacyl-tRNA hydrolase ArfB n=1 Tax=Alkalimonas cellulosilytica TaxID=3058395 RepID=A0ABU7J6J5_9GAMM|nr:alternative ribosome rescue aminoacyl-tRNA hydrolase ArfB [Alkalimonas sp. MEB108]MEE2002144.1 alternative ribosome rescue aminoacyl-tRNA hydrolase ArfB [Alkalimonas sp. MEB108]